MKTEKPFIKLLKSPNSGYFFDVNRNEIIAVSDEAYEFLEKEQQGIDCDATAEVSAELEALRENGYLSGNKVKIISHPLSFMPSIILERKLEQITLQITQGCNMRCKYCVYSENSNNGRHHSDKKMNLDTAIAAVNFLHNHSVDTDLVNIGFYGGEPLLEWKLLKDIIEYSKNLFKGKNISFTLTTNATLLTPEIIDYFAVNKVSMMISLDGTKEAHDKNRVFAANGQGTFDVVIQKLKYIYENNLEYFKKIRLSIVLDPTIDFKLVDKLFFKYDFLKKLQGMTSTIVNDAYTDSKHITTDEFRKAYMYSRFLAYLAHIRRISTEKVSPITSESVRIAKIKADAMTSADMGEVGAPGGPCIPGETKLFVDVYGRLYPCERVNENFELTGIGTLTDGFDFNRVDNILNIAKITDSECRNCWAINLCSQCIKDCIDKNTISKQAKLKNCSSCKNAAFSQLNEKVFFNELLSYRKKTEV